MISKNLVMTALLSVLMTAGVGASLAAVDEHAAHHPATDAQTTSGAAANVVATPADAMANMKKMQTQMTAIHAAKDPKERAKLMNEHMQAMQSMMEMMGQDQGCAMMSGDMAMKSKQPGDKNMMQMMMEQMMQHQKAMQGSAK